ncbi:MAG: membrane protein insertase YidC [Clostridia bacterium]|nr:membrane protein insertase YidC [Clostridia bacterium]
MNFIYDIFSYIMKGCLYISGNHYILALFFFALAMEIILLPLAIKQQKSQIQMAKIKPKEMAIREKYKGRNDRATQQKMTMEIQDMYQQNGYNQFSGCLPLLIQLPIIIILFAIVRQPISYSSNLTKDDADFIKNNAQSAVEYYQIEKESLISDNFDSTAEYDEYVKLIDGYQVELGGKALEEKTESGLTIYEFNDKANLKLAEMALSRLIINGQEDLDNLYEDGKVEETALTAYNDYGFGEYAEDLPEYRIGSLNLLNKPSFNGDYWLLLIPLFVFITSFFSSKIMRKYSGSANQTDANGNPIGGGFFMEVGMPIISAIFAFSFSGAIGAYWIWRTIIGMGKSVVMAKVMPIPVVTEEDIALARKEMKTNQKKKKVITIEVDEDDDSYNDMIVNKGNGNKKQNIDVTTRTPRRIEMLTADDEDVVETSTEDSSDESTDN